LGKLDGKVALVTGSGRGFGRAMAISYAKEGAKVVGASRTKRELDGMVKTAESMGGEAFAISMDLSKEDDINKLRDQVLDKYGRLDILVNNAATSLWKTVEGMSVAEWDFTLAVNLRAPYILTKAFLDTMKKQGSGNIINVTSRSAEIGFVAEIGYCPSKFGIEGLTQALALELKQYNIAVNSLNVGAPEGRRLKPTELTLKEAEEMPEEVKSRYATDEELVEAFTDAWTFLALQDGYGVSGQRLGTKQIAEYLSRYGWEAAKANWSKKLTQAVYVTYDWPKSVRYQTPEGGIKELVFY
jgi:3-oxoacyl-[acyl-carrier protein] reductase/2-hydroxycyclohexanecarboxyl-CoA dehydrogenase